MYCRNCGKEAADDAVFCPSCGVPAGVGAGHCPRCGSGTDQTMDLCPHCGTPLHTPPGQNASSGAAPGSQQQGYSNPYNPPGYAPPQGQPGYGPGYPPPQGYDPYGGVPYPGYVEQKSRLAAGLLGIFIGSLGIHNFYLGYKQRAIIQLAVSLAGGLLTCGVATLGVSIWALVEAIMIFTGSIAVDGYGVPLKD